MVEGNSRQFVASDGYPLHYRHWVPVSDTRGCVIALHGIQSHAGWYEYSSQRLCEAGYEVRFLDRRGSGRNDADRGHAPHAERLINDVVQFLSAYRAETAPSTPVTLMGISWGGKLATVVASRRPELINRLALLYPGLAARVRPKWYQRLLLRLAVGSRARKQIPIPLSDPALFTDNSEAQAFIRDDRLALRAATVGLLNASLDLDAEAPAAVARIHCPVLLMMAGRDRIIDNERTKALFERLATLDRTLKVYPNAAHTLEFEPDRKAIFADLIEWLNT